LDAPATVVVGNVQMAMLEATEGEGMVYGTGRGATGIWDYFASFYGHAWLWQHMPGGGTKCLPPQKGGRLRLPITSAAETPVHPE